MAHTDGRALDHATLEQIRIRAVERVQAGESPEVVIRALGFSRACIYNWLAAYRAGGWGALKAKALSGRPRRVTGRQLQWVYRTVVGKDPTQFHFEFALWTREMVGVLIQEQFGVKLSVCSVGRLLRQLGLSCQRPLWRAYEQDLVRVTRWLTEEYPAIRALARQKGAEIFFSDESGLRSDYHGGTTWGRRGDTPVVHTTGQRFGLNMLSAISAKGQRRFTVFEGKLDGPRYVEFLTRLLRGARRPIFLIVDGHAVHRARLVREFVQSTDGHLRLFCLPPYSPELNPDEQVWDHVKHHGVGRTIIRGAAHLKALVMRRLRQLQRTPALIRMFFRTPDTQYPAI